MILMIGGSLCAWMCGCDDNDDIVPVPYENVDRIAVLVVDDATNTFEGGGVYHYNTLNPTFNLKVEEVPANDAGHITVLFEEGNEIIYYATQFLNYDGAIVKPNPFVDASYFNKVDTEDFLEFPANAIALTSESTDGVEQKWAVIQNDWFIRKGAELKGDNKVFYFKHQLNKSDNKSIKWVFITKY